MKKTTLLLCALLSLCLSAFQVVDVSRPESGEGFTSGTTTGGKLVAVQAFSTNATGTVAIKSIYEAPIYTNAVTILSVTETNCVAVSSNRLAMTSMNRYDVVTNAVEISTNIFTHAVVTNIITSTVVTNVPVRVALSTNVFSVSGLSPQDFARQFPAHTLLSLSTNTVTTTTTNIWPVVSGIVAKTNTLVNGSCSGNVFTGAPTTNTYLKAHEWLIFEGTATGGWLRLIFE